MDAPKRPGIGTYVVFIVVIALVGLGALVLFGGQTSVILSTTSGAV